MSSVSEKEIVDLIKQFSLPNGDDDFGDSVRAKLVKIGKSAIPHLVQALKDENPKIRGLSVMTLIEIIHEEKLMWSEYFSVLLGVLENDRDSKVRFSTAYFLSICDDTNIVLKIEESFRKETDELVRKAILGTIGSVGKDSAIPFLLSVVNNASESKGVREKAIDVLGHMGSAESVRIIIDEILKWDEMATHAATRIEIDVKDERAIPYLISGLKHKNPLVKLHIVKALQKLTTLEGKEYTLETNSFVEQQDAVVRNWELWWENNKNSYMRKWDK